MPLAVLVAVPLLLLAGAGMDFSQPTDVEQLLRDTLRRVDSDTGFPERRRLAVGLAERAATRLRRTEPLFAGATLLLEGSAFEGGHTAADVDTFMRLPARLLAGFDVRREPTGDGFTVHLRPGWSRSTLPAPLAALVTDDGFLSALRFKRWAYGRLEQALREAAAETEAAAVYQTRGAVGADVAGPDGRLMPLDFTPLLAAPPAAAAQLRRAPLRKCGLTLTADPAAPWYLYSAQDLAAPQADTAQRRVFSGDAQSLETQLLRRRPAVRHVLRLVKVLSASRRWKDNHQLESFPLKMATLWSFSVGCGSPDWRDDLLPPILDTLQTLRRALVRGRLDDFWFHPPAQNVLEKVENRERLVIDLNHVIDILQNGDLTAIAGLFQA